MSLNKPSIKKVSASNITLKNTMVLGSTLSFIACWLLLRTLNTYGHLILPSHIEVKEVGWRVVSSTHSLWVVLFALLYFRKNISLLTWYKCLSFSIGYFIFDLSRHFSTETIAPTTLLEPCIHHTITLVVIVSYLNKYPILSAKGFFSELTTPLLYTSWVMLKSGYAQTVYFKVLAVCLLLSFALLRVYNFTSIIRELYLKKATSLELAGFSGIVLINYYWFFRLLHKWIAG